MKRKLKGIFTVVLVVLILLTPLTLSANVAWSTSDDGSVLFTIFVDGEPFEIWGYSRHYLDPAFRLHDIADILNGTAAQFAIKPADQELWDFWIIRGQPYAATDTELQPLAGRHIDGNLFQNIILGVDGDDSPETVIALNAINSGLETYFQLSELAYLLGLSVDWSWVGAEARYSVSTTGFAAANLPIQAPELVYLMTRLAGTWVDNAFFYQPIIDESAVWPQEFFISGNSLYAYTSWSVIPLIPQDIVWSTEWRALSIQYLEDDLVELTVTPTRQIPTTDETAHRIIFDSKQDYITEITYYIGDTAYNMVRFDFWHDASRYTVEATADGSIKLRYIIWPWVVDSWNDREFKIYRSTTRNEIGELIGRYNLADIDYRLLFKFIDSDLEFGQVYYYSLWIIDSEDRLRAVHFDDSWQMVVDTNYILNQPDFIDDSNPEASEAATSDPPEVLDYPESSEQVQTESAPTAWQDTIWLAIIIVYIIVGIVVIMFCFALHHHRRQKKPFHFNK